MKAIKGEKGLTVVELVVTIALLAILTSMCIPKDRVNDYKMYGQAMTLTNDIRMIRSLTMSEGEPYHITMQHTNYTVMNGLKLIKKVELGNDILMVNNTKNKVMFSYKGSPTIGGSIYMKNTATGRSHDITIVPYTGRVLLKN